MSDYGDDDYSDYGDDWFYMEEEYFPADDLAEHAINSPPPTAFGDEDAIEEWDRFDYWNDLEYASDGYDDGKFISHQSTAAETGQKRKRRDMGGRGRKHQRVEHSRLAPLAEIPELALPPVLWRSQAEREPKEQALNEGVETFALLKDWRERLADTPVWAGGNQDMETQSVEASDKGKSNYVSAPSSPTPEDEDAEEEADGMDPAVLMAALQKNLSAAGGPLSGMDPEQLLQFAMRMMNSQGAGDDIAGELLDNILDQGEDDEEAEGEASAGLVSWVSQQRGATQGDMQEDAPEGPEKRAREDSQDGPLNSNIKAQKAPRSPKASYDVNRPPTPPSSTPNRSILNADVDMDTIITEDTNESPNAHEQDTVGVDTAHATRPRKRKATGDVDTEASKAAPKKRATRSFDAPTAASQARAVPAAKSTRSGRGKRS